MARPQLLIHNFDPYPYYAACLIPTSSPGMWFVKLFVLLGGGGSTRQFLRSLTYLALTGAKEEIVDVRTAVVIRYMRRSMLGVHSASASPVPDQGTQAAHVETKQHLMVPVETRVASVSTIIDRSS